MGLPYVKSADTNVAGGVLTGGVDLPADTIYVTPSFITAAATSTIYLSAVKDNAADTEVQVSGLAAGDKIIGSISYTV